ADEAFMDVAPQASLVPQATLPGFIVLRSLGKFFGLAGARVGFVFSGTDLRLALEKELGPWAVSGPAQQLATQALADTAWQEMARTQLAAASERLARLLDECGFKPAGGTALFQWAPTPQARSLHETFARHGILTRLFTDPTGLRFGLPGVEAEWQRLEAALTAARRAVA
ncbi:MAG TPA: aminotransferase class I/II-fold pyridoxal phosphate-dependent enzyme, partial [Burkholderiales bacterium]|nr:aminotransferase class I/II-fold pyridoxal phosphate-dependent enzyme [Burkholderiales bacterium]